MALETREEGKYITTYDGNFSIKVKEGTVGAITRTNKVGKTVHELYYPRFTGKLVDIRKKEDDKGYGPSWIFTFVDAEDKYFLQLPYSDRSASTFLKILPNVDLEKEMTLSISSKVNEKGKKETSFFVNQDGNSLKHFYTKDNPNGLPQWEQVPVKGVLTWDNTKELAFLENMVMTEILPKLGVSHKAEKTDTLDELVNGMQEVEQGF